MASQPRWAYTFTDPTRRLARRRPATGQAQDCPGSCNAPWRKQQQVLDSHAEAVQAWENTPIGPPPAEPQGRRLSPWPGDPVFCPRDTAALRRQLKELDDLAAIRAAEADGHRTGPAAERVRGSRGTPSPSPAVDDLDELAHMLRGWEAVARGDDDTPPRRGRLATEITTVVAWLTTHFDTLITNRDIATDFAREIREWNRRLARAGKAGSDRHPEPVPCPRCGSKSLEAESGATYVECVNRDWEQPGRRCGKLISRSEYDLLKTDWLTGTPAAKAS